MTRNRLEIVETRQIIPADKWYAVYKGDESGEYLRDRIAVWALLKRKNEEEIDHVEGMVPVEGFLEPCEDISNFIDYCHADDIDRLYPESIKKDSLKSVPMTIGSNSGRKHSKEGGSRETMKRKSICWNCKHCVREYDTERLSRCKLQKYETRDYIGMPPVRYVRCLDINNDGECGRWEPRGWWQIF